MNSPQEKNQKNSTEVPPKRSAPKVPTPVDYEYWKKMSIWTIKEALLLLFAIDPAQIDPDKPEQRQIERALLEALYQRVGSNNTEQLQHEGREILKTLALIERAFEFGELEHHPNFEFDPFDPYQKSEDLPIDPETFIKWALKKDLDVPGELRELSGTPGHKNKNDSNIGVTKDQVKDKSDDLPPDVIKLIKKVRPEIELIYNTIKEGEGFKHSGKKSDELRMEDALYCFEEYEDNFKIIKKEDLQNTKIFETSFEQHARAVKGKLLQSIIKTRDLGDYSYRILFKEYQKNK